MLLVTYKNFLPLQSNNRMLAYYDFLEDQGERVQFYFIKGAHCKSSYRHKTFHSLLTGIPFIGIAFGLFSAIIHFAISKRAHDIVYVYSPSALWWPLYWIWKKKGYKIIVERAELDSIREPLHWRDKLLLKLFQWDEKRNEFPNVLISSRLMEYYNKSSSINYHLPAFIDTHFFEKEPKYDQKYRLGYFGTFGQKDHVEGIIEGFKISKQFIPELQLCLMGAVPKKLKNLYASKDLSGLSFVEDIHYHDLNEKLQTCDLLISNRDKSEYSHFGFPTKLIEYLASGIPVISTRVSDIASYFQHEKELYLIEPNNPKELSKAILSRYHNFHSFNEMAQRGKQKVFKTHSQTLLNNWRTFTQSLN